ncbi:MAG: oligoendopeptidase F [Firmicutes bacterium]|nr:oligoendopeptidase F [Bacillota bacterium]
MISAKKRAEIAPEFKWDLSALAPSDAEWQIRFDAVQSRLPGFAAYKNTLAASARNLLACLSEADGIGESFEAVYVYANMRKHEDGAEPAGQGMAEKADTLAVKLSSATSFMEPEILSIPAETLAAFMAEEPGLRVFGHYLDNLNRQREHILSPEMEEMLANVGEIAVGPENIFEMLNDADMKFGSVVNENGEEVEVTHGRYGSLMESPNRDVRRNTFVTYYDSFHRLKNTLAATYGASVKKDLFYSRARKYPSALAASLSGNNIPEEVYMNLIATVREFLPQMHRYVRLRKKRLNLPELRMYDVYAPIVPDIDTNIGYDDAWGKIMKALAVMGPEYARVLETARESGWIDVYENEGKRSGAYSWGAYSAHPYVLLNYDGKIDDMFTIAHEMGHALHAHYSWTTQPHVYGGHGIFLAEVASTCNEALLMAWLRENTSDPAMKAYLVNYFLEQFKGTVFRQTMFAEFELHVHEMADRGEPLTLEALNAYYRGLCGAYFGPDMVIDSQIDMEWARIPHFYNDYYVFQYATGFSAAIAFSKRILREGEPAVRAYTEFLKGGSSVYPIDLLKTAGVDMSAPLPVREALTVFKELLDEMESL